MTTLKRVSTKICLVGMGSVGKTSLIKRFILDIFDDKYLATLGTKVSKKVMIIKRPSENLTIELTMMVWDIMGQKGFRHLLQDSYFFGASGGIGICDSTRADTMEELDGWVESLQSVTGQVPMVFLANKCDLVDQIVLDERTIKEFAGKHNASYYYSSAKTGQNVQEAFVRLGEQITSRIHA